MSEKRKLTSYSLAQKYEIIIQLSKGEKEF